MGKVGYVLSWQCNRDGRLTSFTVDPDGEPGEVEEPAEQRPRSLIEVQGQVGQTVEKCHIAGTGLGYGLLLGVDLRQTRMRPVAIGVEVVEALAERLGERVVRVALLSLAEDVVLRALNICDLAA